MRNDLLRSAAAMLLAGAGGVALACGYCAEDRVAAVYDHDAVRGALAKHRNVGFFTVEGDFERTGAVRRALIAAVERSGGVKGSVRVALASAALSVADDPARTTPGLLAAAANKPLAARGLALSPLRVIDKSGRMREP